MPIRAAPHVDLEEVDSERVVVRIAATPKSEDDGAKLADEVPAARQRHAGRRLRLSRYRGSRGA